MIYFVTLADRQHVKIGHSLNPRQRVRALQLASPHEVILLGACPGDLTTEKELHHRFRQHRVRGEWFHGPPILDQLPITHTGEDIPFTRLPAGVTREKATAVLTFIGNGVSIEDVARWEGIEVDDVISIMARFTFDKFGSIRPKGL